MKHLHGSFRLLAVLAVSACARNPLPQAPSSDTFGAAATTTGCTGAATAIVTNHSLYAIDVAGFVPTRAPVPMGSVAAGGREELAMPREATRVNYSFSDRQMQGRPKDIDVRYACRT